MNDIDLLRERLDAAIDDGPAHPAVSTRLALGRRALRRRRLAAGVAALAAVVVLGFGTVTVAMGLGPALGTDFTTGPSPTQPADGSSPSRDTACASPCPVRYATTSEASFFNDGDPPGGYSLDGDLVVLPGWRVEAWQANPLEFRRPHRSAGLVLSRGEVTYWALVAWSPAASTHVWDERGQEFPRFRDWLSDRVATEREKLERAPVTLEGDQLRPHPHVTVLERTGLSRASSLDRPVKTVWAAAKLRLPDGRIVFALATHDRVRTVAAEELGTPTMHAFLRQVDPPTTSGEAR